MEEVTLYQMEEVPFWSWMVRRFLHESVFTSPNFLPCSVDIYVVLLLYPVNVVHCTTRPHIFHWCLHAKPTSIPWLTPLGHNYVFLHFADLICEHFVQNFYIYVLE